MPAADEASVLGLAAGTPVAAIVRTAYTAEGVTLSGGATSALGARPGAPRRAERPAVVQR